MSSCILKANPGSCRDQSDRCGIGGYRTNSCHMHVLKLRTICAQSYGIVVVDSQELLRNHLRDHKIRIRIFYW